VGNLAVESLGSTIVVRSEAGQAFSAKITQLEVFWAAPRRSEGQGNPTYELGERVYAFCFRWLPE
jgi:hypothetical protein